MKLLQELLQLNETTTNAPTELRKFVLNETDRRYNGDYGYDTSYDAAVEKVIVRAEKLQQKPTKAADAMKILTTYIREHANIYERMTERRAGTVNGTFQAWRSVVTFFGGQLPEQIEEADTIGDLANY